jgi:DNA-binding NtrC family response regulator
VEDSLRDEGWRLWYARTGEEARSLAEQREFLVGLIVLPGSYRADRFDERREVVLDLPEISWIAALPRAQIERDVVRRFVAENLSDFQTLPLDTVRLSVVLGHVYGMVRIGKSVGAESVAAAQRFGLVGDSPGMQRLYHDLSRVAEVSELVLIRGESGTGKEQVARAIHERSARSDGPFVALSCAALPPSLVVSELFGHEKGAFTNAYERKAGYFEAADGGTLLLDEIGALPPEAQVSLLRFLEDKVVTPLGSQQGFKVDVRVIATTSTDLMAQSQKGAFRRDLYYRLSVLTIYTPSLKERRGDIEPLARHFLEQAKKTVGKQRIMGFSEAASRALREHDWPGNAREMRACIIGATLNCSGRYIRPADLDLPGRSWSHRHSTSLNAARRETERAMLERTLLRNHRNVSKTAKDLGVSRMTLYRLMSRHGISRAEVGSEGQ